MKKFHTIALIEFSSVSAGIATGDAMLKEAPVSMIRAGTVSGGHFILLIAGSVGSVEIAYEHAISVGADYIIDSLFLPDVHPDVYDALYETKTEIAQESLGVLESSNVASIIKCADSSMKEADVKLIEMRFADHLGGKSFVIINGTIEEVQAAVEKGESVLAESNTLLGKTIIPRFDNDFAKHLSSSTRFSKAKPKSLSDGEL